MEKNYVLVYESHDWEEYTQVPLVVSDNKEKIEELSKELNKLSQVWENVENKF